MRGYLGRVVTAVVAACAVVCGFAKTPPAVVRTEPIADSLRPLYLYTDAVKQLAIQRDTIAAESLLEQSVALDSTYAPALYRLGVLKFYRDNARALQLLDRAAASDTTDMFYAEALGQALVLNSQYTRAITHFERLTRVTNDLDNYRILAMLYNGMQQPFSAIATLDAAETKLGRNEYLAAMRGQLLLATMQYDRAAKEAQLLVDEAPYKPENHIALAEVYAAQKRDSLAMKAFADAVAVDSTAVDTWLSIGEYHYSRRNMRAYLSALERVFDNADYPVGQKVELFEKLTSNINFYRDNYPQLNAIASRLAIMYPSDTAVMKLYASHLLASGGTEQALLLYKQALAKTPDVRDYYATVIDIEGYLQRPDSVAAYVDAALQRFPRDAELRVQKAHTEILAKRYKDGLAAYRAALPYAATDTLRGRIWGYIGDTQEMLHDRRRAYAAFDKSLSYFYDNSMVLNNYAYFLSLDGEQLARALKMSRRAIELSQNNPTFLDTYAWVLYRLERYDEAKKAMQQALSLDRSDSTELMVHYGDILAALGENFMAKTYWRKALEKGYDKTKIEQRLQQLDNKTAPAE